MDSTALLFHLRRELDAFRACLVGDLSEPVEHCGRWTLHDLAEHLGSANLWAAAAVSEKRGDGKAPPAPRDPAALVRWFDETSSTLLNALDTDPHTEAWTFHPPHTVGFWQRRRCLETLVHRWDAEQALGKANTALDVDLAGEGVAEVFDTMAPRQIARGRASAPQHALHLKAGDTGASWTYGPGTPIATISSTTTESLLLMLWGRIPSSSAAFEWEGDQEAGQRLLEGPLTP